MPARRLRWLLSGAMLVVTGCGAAPATATPGPPAVATAAAPSLVASASRATAPGSNAGTPGIQAGGPTALTIRLSSLRLPTPTTRAVALPSGSGFVVAGGLTPAGTTGRVLDVRLDGAPVRTVGRLAHPVHDAGGAWLHGSMLVLGGGASTQDAWVQRVGVDGRSGVPGRLPSARADLAAVAVGSQLIVVGGGASGRADPRVLATSDGIHFRVLANLPIPVRYAAVAVVGSTVMVMGGTSSVGDVAVIQAVDPGRGTAAVVGRLPQTMSHATALVVGGVVVVAGGRHRGRALDSVLEVDPASFAVRAMGHLPRAESDAAGVVVHGVGYLVGGEAARPLATIVTIAAV